MYTFPLKPRVVFQMNLRNKLLCQMRNSEGKKLKYARVS